jgi:hypothetical protein
MDEPDQPGAPDPAMSAGPAGSDPTDRRLRVAALIAGEPHGPELWTLRSIVEAPCELHVVQAAGVRTVPRLKRARSLLREYGPFHTASRVIGNRLIASREEARTRRILDELFDVHELLEWWARSGVGTIVVPSLNHEDSRRALARIAPDVIVRVSGGILKPHIFSLARLATLNIHHGQAPAIRGMWSIPWGIVAHRRDWIGATVHVIDAGIDTGAVLWRGAPQLAPGDTAVQLHFRAHLEAVAALARILESYARGEPPPPWPVPPDETSTYRTAPGFWAWLRLLALGRGRRARVLVERGIAW